MKKESRTKPHETLKTNYRDDIAVVGVSALYPGSVGAHSFWNNIIEGCDFMTDIPADHWLIEDYYDPDPKVPGKIFAKRGAFLPQIDFDPMQHGLPPKQLTTTDTAQLLALIVAQKVLDDAASVQFDKINKLDISVILGVASATELVGQMAARIQRPNWIKALRDSGLPESQVQEVCDHIEATYSEWDESTFPGLLGNVVAGRIANRLNLGGTNCVVDAACASSLGAVAMAVQELQMGYADLVITGGVDALNDIFMFMCFSKTLALSPSGDCRPFAETADGTMLGEGIGMLALRRLSDAERDGDKIYAVLRGIGSSSDGRAKSIYAPRAEGQEIAIRRAYDRAGYGPEEVGLIEAHGTATKAGDIAEFDGLCRAFANAEPNARQWCALGSVKSQIGHTKAAAGAASLLKVVMALHHKVLPPTIKVDKPNSKLEIETSPFYLNTETRPWIQSPERSRKASVSSFGFGGSNFHITLEEYQGRTSTAKRYSNLPVHLLLFDADTADTLIVKVKTAQTILSTTSLPILARESQLAFSAKTIHRLAILASNSEMAMANLVMAVDNIKKDDQQAFSLPNRLHYCIGTDSGKIAFLFPGQGSQYVNMGSSLAIEFDMVRRVWDETVTMEFDAGQHLHEVVFPIPVFTDADREQQATLLKRTDWAQPAIGATSLSMLQLLKHLGIQAEATAGHSYGEIMALYAAGAISSTTNMLEISRKRGELMNTVSSIPGSMVAVRTSVQQLEHIISQHSISGITLANINSPNQVVIAGKSTAVNAFISLLETMQITCHRLPVATAFHTELVSDCVEPFAQFLAKQRLKPPNIPVYNNSSAEVYPNSLPKIRKILAEQLAKPVQFARMIERMVADGYRIFIEVGPGSVLTAMVADCLQDKPHVAVALDGRKTDGRKALVNALGVLSVNGVTVDYAAFWEEFAAFEATENPDKLSKASVKLNGSNYGKPYPPAEGATARSKPNPERPALVAQTQVQAQPAIQPHTPSQTANVIDENWAASFQIMQQQTLEAQKVFTQTLSDSHQAFLRASEAAFMSLGQVTANLTGATVVQQVQKPVLTTPQLTMPTASPPPVTSANIAVAPTLTTTPAIDHQALLLEVVAEKTGYPVSMLSLDMELESGLGIDSIKRVQILSALQEKIPELASVDTAQLATLSTLGEILDFATKAVPVLAQATTVTSTSVIDHQALLLEVVAEKTGYPVSMLSLDMELESGLGIDSIKRVQILSALQEKIPELASVDTAQLATLSTLGEILDFATKAVPVPAQATTVTSTPVIDHQALLLEVVAEKTGYPVSMLSLDMELESGLGIDSIKRVQILSALQEKIPELASVDTAQLATLSTLGEILDFASGTASASASATLTAAPLQPTISTSLHRRVVRTVQTPASGLATPGLFDTDPLYLVAGNEFAKILADKLAVAEITTCLVASPPADARAVLILSAFDSHEASAETEAQINETVFRHLQSCAQSMATQGRLLVTVQATGGDFGLGGLAGDHAWSAGIAAAAKTAALEWPDVSVKAIDIEIEGRNLDTIAQALANELLAGGPQIEVGLKTDGRRLVPVALEETEIKTVAAAIPKDAVIVVTGGARGVTAACLTELLTRFPLKIAILGRTPIRNEPEGLEDLTTDAQLKNALLRHHTDAGQTVSPQQLGSEVREIMAQRELQRNLDTFASLGATVRYYAVDVGDAKAVADGITDIRDNFGPISGLIHAAGVLADKEIKLKTLEQFQSVLRTKIDGFRHLLNATRQDTLTHIVCFSSVAAWRGNIGQVDYAMANEILNRVCQKERKQRGDSCLVKAIGWGPWAGGMVNSDLQKHFSAMGVTLIPLNAGAKLFADEFTGLNGDATEIIFGGGLDNFTAVRCDQPQTKIFDVLFHSSTYPYIKSHIIHGAPIVPMVTVNDLALHAVQALIPDATIFGTANVKVIKGISLHNYETTGDKYLIECRADETCDMVHVRLLNSTRGLHYTLDVLCSEPQTQQDFNSNAERGFQPWLPESGKIYDGRLFHGPDLQVIKTLQGTGESGCAGTLCTRSQQQIGFNADIDVLDGGLQLAVLWVHDYFGCESLPTEIELFRIFRPWTHGAVVYCEAICETRNPLMTQWNILYRTTEGELLAMIKGLKIHLLPNKTSAKKSA